MYRFWIAIFIFLSLLAPTPSRAIYDPLSVPNNRYGVHILDPLEIESAAKLVNSSGGDWGYVTVPIRADDRDRTKWTAFFQAAARLHVIPIVRLATYFDSQSWATPTIYDLIDFANFLGDMPWPAQNRYVILFNEPNHAKEWGSRVDPIQYATLLVDAREIFKSRSADFFLISGGLDMSAPTNHTSLDALEFYRQISRLRPEWNDAIDGLAVHAYPNPGFSASVYSLSRYGITSYRQEIVLLSRLGYPPKPIFITETGTISSQPFYPVAFPNVWNEPNIIAVTPFLLFAATGEFAPFSLLSPDNIPNSHYRDIFSLSKTAGSPLLSNSAVFTPPPSAIAPTSTQTSKTLNLIDRLKKILSPSKPTLQIKNSLISVEVADSPSERSRGLSGRDSLSPDTGLLFIFPTPDRHSFWMKDMTFALDFIWINSNKVVQVTTNVPPPASPTAQIPVIRPDFPVIWVLEVPAGFVKEHQVEVGDPVVLNSYSQSR